MLHILSTALLAFVLWGLTKIMLHVISRSRPQYPPGPPPKFIIGNTLDFPLVNAPQTYMEWGKKYNSGIIHIEALGNHIIVLNSIEDADALLEKRADIYSDRPMAAVLKLMGWDYNIAAMRHNDKWRLHRKICQQNFRKAEAVKYHPVQIQKVHQMLQGLLESPQEFENHSKMLSISIPMFTMYGYNLSSLDDPCIKAAEESAVMGSTLLLPGSALMNIIPILEHIPAWVPGNYAAKTAAHVRRLTEEMKRIPAEYAMKQLAEGKAIPSLVTDMLERKFTDGVSAEEEEATHNVAWTVYSGASDTTIAATRAFFYFMATNPSVQKKAQAEIDRVIGSKRLPTLDDRDSNAMPHVEAIYRELLRMAAPLPLCAPHAVSKDDYYKGYFVPKGATVFANIWGMTHDETKYPDAFTFKPERFLDEHGKLNDDNRILAYGFGRRVCVGKYIASSTMWLIIVSVLACFDIGKAMDEDGKYIEINHKFLELGLLRHKAEYKCSFKIRSSQARQLVTTGHQHLA